MYKMFLNKRKKKVTMNDFIFFSQNLMLIIYVMRQIGLLSRESPHL